MSSNLWRGPIDGISAGRGVSVPLTRRANEPAYRGDIDGLRAVAVVLVVLFHAWPWLLPGGFVGVDIFFVISGYLITGIIRSPLERGTFSYREFFGRRIRRIGPALFVVLLASLAMGWFIVPYADFRELGLQVTAAAGFSANILFWLQSGYFDGVADGKPLLHLWSLGVEEQFYLVWPALMATAAIAGVRSQVIVPSIIVLSFVFNVAMVGAYPDATFYLLPSRLWELGLGGLLAWHHRPRIDTVIGARANLKAILGCWLIAISALCLDSYSPFPGWRAVLPTVGAMLLIDAGQGAWISRYVLSSPPLRGVGLISYPIYLWHWPLLVFASFAGYTAPGWKVVIVTLALLLSFLTYRFVEVPIRFGALTSPRSRPIAASGILAGMLLAAGLGHFAPLWQRIAYRLPTWAVENYRAEAFVAYREGSCFLGFTQTAADFAEDCDGRSGPAAPRSGKLVMLWGDSHAAQLYPGLLERQQREGQDFRLAQYTATICPPVFDIFIGVRRNCHGVVDAIETMIGRIRPDIVIMAGAWSYYAHEHLSPERITETVRRLHALGVADVIVVGPVPEWNPPLTQAVLRHIDPGNGMPPEYLPSSPPLDLDATIRAAAIAGGARYISAIEALCDDRLGCLATVATARGPELTSFDSTHLTAAGSIAFIDRIWDRQIAPDLSRGNPSPPPEGNVIRTN